MAAFAWVAQLVEQRIENPRVGGSNPPPGTIPPGQGGCAHVQAAPTVLQPAAILSANPRPWIAIAKYIPQRSNNFAHRWKFCAPLCDEDLCSAVRIGGRGTFARPRYRLTP